MFLHCSLLCILGYFSTPTGARTTEHFDYHMQLLAKNHYMFYWKHNATHLTFEIHADTTGYVGFGFSKNASMFPGDVMVAWVANGAKHIYWGLLCIVGYFSTSTVARTTEHFDYHTQLLAKNNFMLYWKHNATHLTFEIHADTTGYVSFGVSERAAMAPGDIMLAWVSNGTPYLYDYHTVGHRPPVLDHRQDWKLQYANEHNGKMTVKVARKISLHGSDDMTITTGNMNLIFAYHDQDPASSQLTSNEYHGENKGTKAVNLLRNPSIVVGK